MGTDDEAAPPAVPETRVLSQSRVTRQCGIDELGRLAEQRRSTRPPAAAHENKLCNPGDGRGPLSPRDDQSTPR